MNRLSSITIIFFSLLLSFSLSLSTPVYAQGDPIGTINPTGFGGLFSTPPISDTGQLTAVVILMNLVLRIIFIVAGLWTFLNFIIAGFDFMSASGDSKKVASAWTRIWQSLVGLIIIVASFLVAAIIGLVLYGNVTAILNPTITPTP
ncbi:hypothetical protein A3D77_01560 [Candidatus Gottesmanbacteria bacterium RIFCSPHIGHO2_02_FULL_39_11]|uniref:Integral membrane protein n=1 Tax=Candidatus Gottesmanbacteria bacterium RIFCSPHIGHO2_02_FULL_39_11 TaxID=1798382 RepID=A0A1F5ZT82_9BACT|nr:MAG: hypothetical protein A3D77_01560 [Candidatus Gottesmanbacteria bacterium RIFCSPHIGHO2_02_FULL_39_11]